MIIGVFKLMGVLKLMGVSLVVLGGEIILLLFIGVMAGRR